MSQVLPSHAGNAVLSACCLYHQLERSALTARCHAVCMVPIGYRLTAAASVVSCYRFSVVHVPVFVALAYALLHVIAPIYTVRMLTVSACNKSPFL